MKKKWTVGTRGSKLALKQTEIVIQALKTLYPYNEFAIKIIKTTGDTIWDKPLHLIGGKGLFVKEIEDALLKNEIDMAVHSMKDLPTELENGLVIGAVLEREDPRDVFISSIYGSIQDIREGSRIGTSSTRRKSQILHFRRGLEIVPLRGNVDTRIKKLHSHTLDGIILAYAGVKRMGFDNFIKEVLPFEIMVPPPGQGAIGIETKDESDFIKLLKPLNHENTFREVTIERELQSMIGGGCQVPLGINASIASNILTLHVVLGREDGELLVKEMCVEDVKNANDTMSRILQIIRDKQKCLSLT
ncbi:MAG: hydroxymethylbilane synthase [Proteobacteria bacterium]|nr:hydroxymethylbilane synthase [Pseudomonadota bacterium]